MDTKRNVFLQAENGGSTVRDPEGTGHTNESSGEEPVLLQTTKKMQIRIGNSQQKDTLHH